jgi:uncharacterized membrane protein
MKATKIEFRLRMVIMILFVALAFFSWSYNNWLMIRVIIVSFGLSMIVWALVPEGWRRADSAE